jgi:hypothetical protein
MDNLKNKIYDFYNVSQSARNNAYKTEMYIVKDSSLSEMAEREMRLDRSRERKALKTEEEIAEFERSVKEEAQSLRGRNDAITKDEGLILIKESHANSHTKIHEILHSMSRNTDDLSTDGLSTAVGKNLNEATTDILALHYEYPDLDAWGLYTKIYNGEIRNFGYPNLVKKMLTIMAHTGESNPFTIKDLAKHYFHDVQAGNISFADLMIKEITSKMQPELQEKIATCLANDLQGRI